TAEGLRQDLPARVERPHDVVVADVSTGHPPAGVAAGEEAATVGAGEQPAGRVRTGDADAQLYVTLLRQARQPGLGRRRVGLDSDRALRRTDGRIEGLARVSALLLIGAHRDLAAGEADLTDESIEGILGRNWVAVDGDCAV